MADERFAQTYKYPSDGDIDKAGVEQLLRWSRELPQPFGKLQKGLLQKIMMRLGEERRRDPAAYEAADQKVGW